MRLLILAAALALATAAPAAAQQVQATKDPALKQWVYLIRPIPRLRDEKAWTPADNQAAGAHFQYLQKLTADGVVVMAGRTMQPLDDKTVGMVVFEAASEAEARRIADADPAVKAGVFTMEMFPFAIALQRKP